MEQHQQSSPNPGKAGRSGPDSSSSLKDRILTEWVSTFSLKIRLLEGQGKYFLGALINASALATFVTLFCLALTTYSETTYMSLTFTEYEKSSYDRSTTECSTVPLSVSSTIYVDENGVWSSESNYNSFKVLKQITFTNFEGDESDFDQAIEELNNCIGEINAYTSNHSFQSNLIYLGFTECQAANETLTMSFPMKWNYIYDFSLYSVMATLVLPNDWSWNNAMRKADNMSSFSGKVSMQVDTMLNLHITCAANYTTNNSMAGQDYCGLLYNQLYGETVVQTEEKEVNIKLDLDSVARCTAINKHLVDGNATDDLLVTSTGTADGSYSSYEYYYAYLQGADNPTLMYIMPQNHYCVLVYKDEDQDIAMYPIMEYTDDTCYSVFKPVSESCSQFEETGCPSEFGADIVLWMYDSEMTKNYGAIRMTAKGARRVLNSNLYYYKDNANLSCQPLLGYLPNSSQESVPVDLIEDYYKCTTRAAESYSSALSEAWANSQIALVCVTLLISTVVLRFFGSQLGQRLNYNPTELELAQLELALARVEEKKQLSLPLKAASMTGLSRDSEEGGAHPRTPSSAAKKALSSVPEKVRGNRAAVHPDAAGPGASSEGTDLAALLAQLAGLRAEVGALRVKAGQVDELRAEVEALRGAAGQVGALREEVRELGRRSAAQNARQSAGL